MRLTGILRYVFLVFVVVVVLLTMLFSLRFPLAFFEAFVASFITSLVCTAIGSSLVLRLVRLNVAEQLICRRQGILIDTGLRGGIALIGRITDQPIPIDLSLRTSKIEAISCITQDGASINIGCMIIWRIVDPLAFASAPTGCESTMNSLVTTSVQNQINLRPFRDSLAARNPISMSVSGVLRANPVLLSWGIQVVDAQLTSVTLPPVVQGILARELAARLVGPAMVQEGENFANVYGRMQAIAGNDAALLQVLKTLGDNFGKK